MCSYSSTLLEYCAAYDTVAIKRIRYGINEGGEKRKRWLASASDGTSMASESPRTTTLPVVPGIMAVSRS